MPRTIGGNSGLVRSGISTPTVYERAVFSPRAIGFGRYPRRSAAANTRLAVSSLTSSRVSRLSARDAVPGCTPAIRATSLSVTRAPGAELLAVDTCISPTVLERLHRCKRLRATLGTYRRGVKMLPGQPVDAPLWRL